ncbi:MAG TPA: sensor domain-containing diguanylate cyclase [Oligoflexia bacterium]|nr:sensor domain-containing diguanylate cyclase [Oligoflexia bacterium]
MTTHSPESPAAKAAYYDLFDRSLDAILLVSLENLEILQANDATENVLLDKPESLTGVSLYQFSHADDLVEFQKMIRIAMRRYHPKRFETRLNVGDPTKIIVAEMAASPLKLKDESEVLQVIVRDVTAQKDAEKRLRELATTDGMTGLVNYRQFCKLLETEHLRSDRYKKQYSIVFCDIDHFKNFNDTNGHPAGDDLLREFAGVLETCVRNTDVAARYGGEEFVVLCTETDLKSALIVGERIRSAVADHAFEHGKKQPMGFVSISVGISGFPQSGKTWQEVLKAADEALYKSKEGGRNRVTIAP